MKDYFAQFWGVRADGSNVGQRLQDCLNDAGNEGGGRVVLNTYSSDTTDEFLIDSPIVIPPNVSLESTSDAKVKIRKSTSLANWIQLNQGNKLQNINLLSDGNVTNSMVQFLSGFSDCSVIDCDFSNGTETVSSLRMVQMFNGEGGVVEGCFMDRPKWGIQATDDNGAKNIRIKNNKITNVNDDGNHIFVSGIDGLKIQDNELLEFIDTVKGSHHIQFRSKHVGGVARLPSTDVEISGNTVTGVPGVAAISGVNNGASGDMVVLRNVIGGRVFGNTLRHGGELGIDVVDSSSDVHVYENDIAFIDASGIIVGSSLVLGASPDNRVENVHVYRNTISDVGLDAAGTIQRMSRSGIRFWNCRRASAYFNEIYRPGSYGISVRANDADAPEYDVEEFSYGLNNCYEMNGEPHFFAGFNPTINEDTASGNYTTPDDDGAASWSAVPPIPSDWGSELTLSNGEITITNDRHSTIYHVLDTEADAATDDLVKINGGFEGQVLRIKTASAARDINIIFDSVDMRTPGNIDVPLNHSFDYVELFCRIPGRWVVTNIADIA